MEIASATLPRVRRPALYGAAIFVALIVLAGCTGATPQRLWPKAPGWSRPMLVGATRSGDPPPTVLAADNRIYFLLLDGADSRYSPRVVAFNRSGEMAWERAYEEIAIARPDLPKMLWDGRDLLLFWLSNEQLYQTQVEPTSGLMRTFPVLLSGDTRVADYDVALDSAGRLHVWYTGPEQAPGLFALTPDAPADDQTIAIDPAGLRPDITFDADGNLHAVWARYTPGRDTGSLIYGVYPQGRPAPGQEHVLGDLGITPTSVLGGPSLGLDTGRVYAFWSVETRTGPSAGAVNSHYATFPIGQPEQLSITDAIYVPESYKLTYEQVPDAGLQTGARAQLIDSDAAMTAHVDQLAPDPNVQPELAVAARVLHEYLYRKSENQIGVAYFRDGAPHSYQLISFTAGDSTSPWLFSDEQGALYLSWLERGETSGFDVYFASTAPDIVAALRSLTRDDLSRLTAETLFGLATGALLIPLALIWIVAPIIVLVLTWFLRRENVSLTHPGTLISVILAIAAFWMAKLAFLPDMRTYVPFSAWIPIIPAGLALPLRILVPALIALLALWLAWRFSYGRARRSAFFFVLLYVIIDSVLTTAIYGVLFFASG